MYDKFLRKFEKDAALSVTNKGELLPSEVPSWADMIHLFGGNSFNKGLYRIIRWADTQ